MRRSGFTLIELLVVMSIIALLAAMVMIGVSTLRTSARGGKTRAILHAVQQALEQHRANRGGTLAPVEHPCAGSKAPRRLFIRADGTALPTTGIALRGATPAQLGGNAGRLLLDSDLFADPAVPLLYGIPRQRLSIPGAILPEITAYRLIDPDAGSVSNPDTAGQAVPDLSQAGADGSTVVQVLQYILGAGSAQSELANLGALHQPPDDTQRILGGRLWSDNAPGTAQVPRSRIDDSGWTTYRLRGLGLYDVWGRELLYSLTSAGGIRIESAGADGCLRWDPGADGSYQTAANATVPAGDDRDATRDNLSTTP
jgi:prepilin-type N-terminal cleavage/methylation domain-containing protein